MKLHTFLLVMTDSDYYVEEYDFTEEQHERLRYTEDTSGFITVKGIHPKFEDNLIEVRQKSGTDTTQFFRDHKGHLWCFCDYLTREQAISLFE